jgi:pyridinium-3,5-biscarboxylic acid mononucleotide sulfurtransferase
MSEIEKKHRLLVESIKNMGSVAVAFSGGVDSTLLVAVSVEALGDKAIAVIGRSPTYAKREYDAAVALAKKLGCRYQVVDTCEFDAPGFNMNPPNRCFLCKNALFEAVWNVARKEGFTTVLEGTNVDDLGDYRPGMKASKELGVKAPLVDLGFSKDDIRVLSKKLGLSTWNKPALACLSSRIPYGESINTEKLKRIEKSENALRDMGIEQLRVRDHGDVARIEVSPGEIERLSQAEIRNKIVEALTSAGYRYVCLDLKGYRTGSMNETLTSKEKQKATD